MFITRITLTVWLVSSSSSHAANLRGLNAKPDDADVTSTKELGTVPTFAPSSLYPSNLEPTYTPTSFPSIFEPVDSVIDDAAQDSFSPTWWDDGGDLNKTMIESDGEVFTQADYERLIDDTVKELEQLSSIYGRVVDVDSAVEILGVDRTWATKNNVEIQAKDITDLFKGVTDAIEGCKNGCTDPGAVIKGVSSLISAVGGFVAIANPVLGVALASLGGIGSIIGVLFGEETKSGITIDQIHAALRKELDQFQYEQDLNGLIPIAKRVKGRVAQNGVYNIILSRNANNQLKVDEKVVEWRDSWKSEWSFWLERLHAMDTAYNSVYGPIGTVQGRSHRERLLRDHIHGCQSECSVRHTDPSSGRPYGFDANKWTGKTMRKGERLKTCGSRLDAGENALNTMGGFAIAYLEIAPQLIEYASSGLSIMSKQSNCDPFKYDSKHIEDNCKAFPDIQKLQYELQQNVKHYVALFRIMKDEIPNTCLPNNSALWPFNQHCKWEPNTPDSCNYANIFVEKKWLLKVDNMINEKSKLVELFWRMPSALDTNALYDDCMSYYNANGGKEGFGHGTMFNYMRGYGDGKNHCFDIAGSTYTPPLHFDSNWGNDYVAHSMVAMPNYCIQNNACTNVFQDDSNWGYK
jgi:hypothetical protein